MHGASFSLLFTALWRDGLHFGCLLQYFGGRGTFFAMFCYAFVGIWQPNATCCYYLQWSGPHGNDFAIIYCTLASFRREDVHSRVNISKKCSLVCGHGRQPYPTLGLLSGGFIIGVPAFRVVPPHERSENYQDR